MVEFEIAGRVLAKDSELEVSLIALSVEFFCVR